jgi:hypothetical protein
MNRRITLSVGAAAGGLLATGFLPVAVAFADGGNGTVENAASTSPLGSAGDAGGPTPLETVGTAASGDSGSTAPAGDTPGITPTDETPGTSDAFTIGNYTFDPVQADGTEGYSDVNTLFSAPPFFEVGQGEQTFDVTSAAGSDGGSGTGNDGSGSGTGNDGSGSDAGTSGSGSDATGTGSDAGSGSDATTDLGQVSGSEDVANLFGIHNTEFTVDNVDPASGVDPSSLPAEGTVYDVANFGNGFENVYTDVPGQDGGAGSVTDTLVTPFGNFDLSNLFGDFDATQALSPGDALTGVDDSGSGGLFGGGSDLLGGGSDLTGDLTGSGSDALGNGSDALGNGSDALGGAAGDAGSGVADAAGGAGDAAGGAADIDPLSFLGF